MRNNILAIVAAILVAASIGLAFWGIASIDWAAVNSYQEPAQNTSSEREPQPLTKTRCDYTGVRGGKIIEEEAQNGYRYTGRTNDLFCQNALVFELKEQK